MCRDHAEKGLWCNTFTSNRHVFDGEAQAECQICPVGSSFGARFPGSQVPPGSVRRSRLLWTAVPSHPPPETLQQHSDGVDQLSDKKKKETQTGRSCSDQNGEGRERVLEMYLSGRIQTRSQSHGIMRFSLSDGENLKTAAGSQRVAFTCSEEIKALLKEMNKVLTALTPSHTHTHTRS